MNRGTSSVCAGTLIDRLLGARMSLAYCFVGLAWIGGSTWSIAADSESDANKAVEHRIRLDDSQTASKPSAPLAVADRIGEPTFRRIGPVTTITEVSSGLPFPARVDTGATTCSIHYEEIEIQDASDKPEDNVGKVVRVLIQSPDGKQQWVSTKIVEHVTVRTSTDDEQRYKVPMKLRWEDVEKKVLVTLKDRERMTYPLLLGRNFLKGDFLVDVNLDVE